MLYSSLNGYARLEDGTLGIIKLPNEGCPVILAPGQTFKITAEQKGDVFLIDDEKHIIPLNSQWEKKNPETYEGLITLTDKEIKEGPYAIQIVSEKNEKDINPRSVWIRKEFKEYYVFAHISDIHILKGDLHDENAITFQTVIEKLNQSDAHFILITGDLTHNALPEQWQVFLNILNQSQKPTFVCAGNHDRDEDNYEKMFFTSLYAFRYGKDGFIVFDTREYRTADSWREQDALLYRYRRELKSSRWTFGITHRYEFTMGIRSQITLFIDDPIDFILYGHIHRENTKEESIIPWGKTRTYVVPAEKDGYYRIFDVGEGGLFPRPIQNIKGK
ncbi:MAG: metallophosphoesterase family protein [Candidatus Hydrogenedens sp.]